jgi:hypothetical protein
LVAHDHAAYYSLHLMHCIYLSVSLLPTVIDPMEQEREEPPELAPVEATNPEQDQGKPQCI